MLEEILENKPSNTAICLLTDLYIKNNGNSVMGDHVSKIFLKYYPDLNQKIGEINRRKEKVVGISYDSFSIINFPVKPEFFIVYKNLENVTETIKEKTFSGDILPGWANLYFDKYIVQKSCEDLSKIQNNYETIYFALPTKNDYDNENNKILYKNLKKYIELNKLKFIKCNIGDEQ